MALGLIASMSARADICDWADVSVTADGGTPPTTSWTTTPPCVTTGALYKVAVLRLQHPGAAPATNVQVQVEVDAGLIVLAASRAQPTGNVQFAAAPAEPILWNIPLLPAGADLSLTIRVRHASWAPTNETPRADWAWCEFWPACDRVGNREAVPGVLIKQLWARDLYWALEERCQAVHTNGSDFVWGVLRPSWWTESGVTNRVVRYTSSDADTTDLSEEDGYGSFLAAAKVLTARLARYYLNNDQVDPALLPASWQEFHEDGGARVDIPLWTNTFTKWRWECPGANHTETYLASDTQTRLGTNGWTWTSASLAESVDRPWGLLGLSPYRWLEGSCAPPSSNWIYRATTSTGVCNWASFDPATAEDGDAPTVSWQSAPGCISNGLYGASYCAVLRLVGAASGATNVRVEIEVDESLQVVHAFSPGGGNVEWYGAPSQPVVVQWATLPAGAERFVTVCARSRREQGPDPDRVWYWSDFGWDATREAIQALSVLKEPTGIPSPLYSGWQWAGGGSNQFGAAGYSERAARYDGGALDLLLSDGDFEASVDDAETALTFYSFPTAAPFYRYYNSYTADTPPATGLALVECRWRVSWSGCANNPAIFRRLEWPPAGVTVVAKFMADVQTADDDSFFRWDAEQLGSVSLSTGTNTHVFATAVGDADIDLDNAPGDPSAAKGKPILGEGSFDDSTDDGASEARGNHFLNYKSWSTPFLVLEYTFALP